MDLPKKLYKYQNFNNYSLSNLKSNQIYFSNPFEFNDPFEFYLRLKKKQLSDDEYKKIYKRALNISKCNGNFIEKNGTVDNIKQQFKDELNEKIRSKVDFFLNATKGAGVCCFSEKFDNLLMWSHYSDGHKGFCLEYDTKIEPFSKPYKVHYSSITPEIDPVKILLDKSNEIFKRIIKKKSSCWKYEKEWRIFHKESNILFGCSTDALTGIYFGAKMDMTHIEIITLILRGQNPKTKLYKGELLNNSYKLDFKKVNYTPYCEIKDIKKS